MNLVIKNSAALLLADITGKVLNVLFFAFLARYWGPKDTGIFITLITFFSIGIFFTDPGLSQVMIRDLAREPQKGSSAFRRCLSLSILLWVPTLLGIIGVGWALEYPRKVIALMLLGGVMIGFQAWAQLASAFLQSQQRMAIVAFWNSTVIIFFSLLGMWAVSIGYGLTALVGILALQGITGFCLLLREDLSAGLRIERLVWDAQGFREVIRETAPMAALALSGILLNRLDIIMLSKFKGMDDTAIYGLAVRIIDNLSLISGSVMAAVFPFLSLRWKTGNEEIIPTIRKATRFFLALGLTVILAAFLFSHELILFFFGSPFRETAYVFIILSWSFLFAMMGAPLTLLILMERDRMRGFIGYAFGVVALNVSLNLWLIPAYSFVGAGISTLSCSLILFLFKYCYVRKYFPVKLILMAGHRRESLSISEKSAQPPERA